MEADAAAEAAVANGSSEGPAPAQGGFQQDVELEATTSGNRGEYNQFLVSRATVQAQDSCVGLQAARPTGGCWFLHCARFAGVCLSAQPSTCPSSPSAKAHMG